MSGGIDPPELHAVPECLLDNADIGVDRKPGITLSATREEKDEYFRRVLGVPLYDGDGNVSTVKLSDFHEALHDTRANITIEEYTPVA